MRYAQLAVNRRNAELLDQFAELSRARYEVGNAREADVLTAKTDGARLDDIQADILLPHFRRPNGAERAHASARLSATRHPDGTHFRVDPSLVRRAPARRLGSAARGAAGAESDRSPRRRGCNSRAGSVFRTRHLA